MRKEVLLVGKSRRRQLRKREGKRGANYHRKQNSRERERFKYFWKHLQNGMECKHLPLRKIQWFKTHATPPPLPQKTKQTPTFMIGPCLCCQTHILLFTPSTVSYLQLVSTLSHFSAIALAIFSATFSLIIPF